MCNKKRITMLIIMLFASVMTGTSQTRDEFRLKYGMPEDGHYLLRSNIIMNALYSEDGQAQVLTIEPENLSLGNKSEIALMSSATVTEIITELVPDSRRGRLIHSMTFDAGCSSTQTSEYEKVFIYRTLICSSQSEEKKEKLVEIKFKKIRVKEQ